MRNQEEEVEEEGENPYAEGDAAMMARFGDDSLRSALMRQWGAAPWYVGSFGLHMLVFAILLLFAPDAKAQPKKKVKVEAETVEEEIKEEEKEEEEPPEEEVTEVTEETEITNEVTVNAPEVDVEVSDVEATEEEAQTDTADFATDNDSDTPITMGLNPTYAGASKGGGKFNTRGKGKGALKRKHKVSKGTTNTLNAGLYWLAKVQEDDGHWDCAKYGGHKVDAAATGLALLAFLGDGNSTKVGPFKKNVRAAQSWLTSKYNAGQKMIGNYKYEAAVTLMAMSEAWAMSEDKDLQPLVQNMVDMAAANQANNGGWGYTQTADPVKAHVDTSVTGWWVMALKGAKIAGAKVPETCWNNSMSFFRKAYQPDKHQTGYWADSNNHENSLTPVSIACLQFLGAERNDPMVVNQAAKMLKSQWLMGQTAGYDGGVKSGKKQTHYYSWYYQALGLFQYGTNTAEWKKLRENMEPILLALQEKEGFNKGSWSADYCPTGNWGYEASCGRVGITATACLMLEVFYRFDDCHKKSH